VTKKKNLKIKVKKRKVRKKEIIIQKRMLMTKMTKKVQETMIAQEKVKRKMIHC
jgi:hypothetical protein